MGKFILRYSIPFYLMNNMKKQKDMTLKDELPRLVGAQYITGEACRNSSRNNAKLWICLVVKLKFDAVKNNIA